MAGSIGASCSETSSPFILCAPDVWESTGGDNRMWLCSSKGRSLSPGIQAQGPPQLPLHRQPWVTVQWATASVGPFVRNGESTYRLSGEGESMVSEASSGCISTLSDPLAQPWQTASNISQCSNRPCDSCANYLSKYVQRQILSF